MFVRVNSTPNSPRKSVQIVTSKRNGHKVSTKIIRHIGIATDDHELQALKALAADTIGRIKHAAEHGSPQGTLFGGRSLTDFIQDEQDFLNRKKGRPKARAIEDILPPDQVKLIDVEEEKRIVEGVDEIAGELYDELGFMEVFASKKTSTILKDLVLTRLVEHHSKHKLQQIMASKFDKEHDLDAIYRMMDQLHPQIDEIKTMVHRKTKSLIAPEVNMMFFDVTTLYFESITTSEEDIRKFGYSKDHRFNTTQVVLALATNTDGLPLGYELFDGNKAEVSTLVACLDKWKEHLDIKQICFVGDRAMFCEGNLALLEERGYSYVVAAKLRGLTKDMQEQILDENNYQVREFDKEIGWVGEFDLKNRRLITSYKTARAKNDAQKRQAILDKITKILSKSTDGKGFVSNSGVKKYTSQSKSEVVLDQAKVDADAAWDGMHGVITNIKDSPAEAILKLYKRLWVIEESFRISKHNLKMRPIYHYKRERIEAHIAICYMSFAILRHLQYRVNLTQKISVNDIIEELLGVQASIHRHKITGDRYRLPGYTSQKASKIYKAMGKVRSRDATIYL